MRMTENRTSLNSVRNIEASSHVISTLHARRRRTNAELDSRSSPAGVSIGLISGGTMAHLAEDLAVTLENDRPGMLAKAIGCVSAAGLNIDGYTEMNGVVHVLTTDLKAARQCLHDNGFR